MTSVIDFELKRQQKQAAPEHNPDPHLVRYDDKGRPLYCFIVEYQHEGQTARLDFWDYTAADAQDHLLSMIATLTFVGQKIIGTP